jgi:quinoprotein glucose dehydrogenase
LDDAFDLTPELKAEAQAAMRKYRIGPLFTPPSIEGTIMRPGSIGGANWGGGAFDAASGYLFVKTTNQPTIARVRKSDRTASNPRAAEVDAEIVGDFSGSTDFIPSSTADRPQPLPMLKPPYGHLVAIDLNQGSIAWRIPFGDNPLLRAHPALVGVKLPESLGTPGAPGVLVTRGGLVFAGGSDLALHAFDTLSGRELWKAPLPRRATGTPMTYRSRGGRQFVVIATSTGPDASLMAFALPR